MSGGAGKEGGTNRKGGGTQAYRDMEGADRCVGDI